MTKTDNNFVKLPETLYCLVIILFLRYENSKYAHNANKTLHSAKLFIPNQQIFITV